MIKSIIVTVMLAGALFSQAVFSQTSFLKDTYTVNGDNGSYPRNLTVFNGKIYFNVHLNSYYSIWETDGTSEGTREVLPLSEYNIGMAANDDFLLFFTSEARGERLVFNRLSADNQVEAYFTVDGGYFISSLVSFVYDNRIYFPMIEPNTGAELWYTDGTAEGTGILKDIRSGPEGSSPGLYTQYNGLIYFRAMGRLYVTDGTEEGTNSVDWHPFDSAMVGEIKGTDSGLVCRLSGTDYPYEYWFTDGTEAGTKLITRHEGYANPYQVGMEVVSDYLFYVMNGYDGGMYLVKTHMDTGDSDSIYSGSYNDRVAKLDSYQNRLLFFVNDANINYLYHSSEPYTECTAFPGTVSYYNYRYSSIEAENKKFIIANYPIIIDGNDFSITKLDDYPSVNQSNSTIFNGKLFFDANNRNNSIGNELYMTDGTYTNTQLVKNINTLPYSSNMGNLIPAGSRLFFTSQTEEHGIELWNSQGQAENTVMVKDINPFETYQVLSSSPDDFLVVDDILYFTAFSEEQGRTLNGIEVVRNFWKSDGTTDGTKMVKDLGMSVSSYSGHNINNKVLFKEKIFFGAYDDSVGYELFSSGGSEESTEVFLNIRNEEPWGFPYSSFPEDFMVAGDNLFFTANLPETGRELWVSDGTVAGTSMLMDIRPGNIGSMEIPDSEKIGDFYRNNGGKRYMIPLGESLIFASESSEYGRELWISSGTEETTFLLKDINPGEAGSFPGNFYPYNQKILFVAYLPENGLELWSTDGTTDGTHLIKDIFEGPQSGISFSLEGTEYKGHFYFTAYTEEHGFEIWRTDGTAGGTEFFDDIFPGNVSSNPHSFMVHEDMLFILARDGFESHSLWYTDADKVKFRKAYQFDTEPTIIPDNLTKWNGDFYFTAFHPEHGQGLYKYVYVEDPVLGLEDELATGIRVFPNPVQRTLSISCPETLRVHHEAALVSLQGQYMSKLKLKLAGNNLYNAELPLFLGRGLYVLEMSVNGRKVSMRILKE